MRSRSRVGLGVAVAALAAAVVGPGVAGAAVPPGLSFAPSSHSSFAYGSVQVGTSATQVFTLTQNGWGNSGQLAVALRGSRAFAVTADSCSGQTLANGASCQVTVVYSPKAANRGERALLTVGTNSRFWWHGWHSWYRMRRPLFLSGNGTTAGGTGGGGSGSGSGSGPASLTLSPATQTSPGVWSFDFGQAAKASQVFTITNVGGTSTAALVLAGFNNDMGFMPSSNTCSDAVLAPGQSCTFTENWTSSADPVCDGIGIPDSTSATVTDATTAYIEADLSATCG